VADDAGSARRHGQSVIAQTLDWGWADVGPNGPIGWAARVNEKRGGWLGRFWGKVRFRPKLGRKIRFPLKFPNVFPSYKPI
jgi:hypothetical protein